MSEKINLNVTLSLRIKNTVASVAQIMVDIVMAPIVDQLCLKKKIRKTATRCSAGNLISNGIVISE